MNKDIALVLSSGGARGFAHIGAIKVLEDQGYNITSVAGTSMGALVGNELNLLSNRIVEQNREIMSLQAGPAKEARSAQVKALEKDRKKLQKEIGKSEKNIRKAKSTVNDAEKMIPKNEEEQNKMEEKLDEQKAVVQKYVDKLNTVKSY